LKQKKIKLLNPEKVIHSQAQVHLISVQFSQFTMLFKRFFCSSPQILARFKAFPPENAVKNRSLVAAIAESSDKTAFFAWHPKQSFAYEYTRPLPTSIEQKSSSLLKEQSIAAAQVAWKLKHPDFSRTELSKVTFTSKHRWFPRSRDKKMNYKKVPMDRTFL
jgi:large subunit ribosomal protein L42